MTLRRFLNTVGSYAALAVVVLAGMLVCSPRLRAEEGDHDRDRDRKDPRIERGLDIAPVPLNLKGKNRNLVGLGSYLVNASGDCNACHNPGPGNNQFAPGGNPYHLGETKKVDPTTYLGGGRDFGPVVPGVSAHIVSRNLTPDKTGRPQGGHTFAEFRTIMRTGVDMDNLHPTCPAGVVDATCVPPPFNGALLQVMPWFNFQDMTDHELRAIYEYLRAIPCIAGPDAPSPLHNDCE